MTPQTDVQIETDRYKTHLAAIVTTGLAAIQGHHRISNEDHLAFMAFSFAAKQLIHADSILLLDNHPDTQLIARSMLEGTSQLLWARQEPTTRPWLWRMFVHVLDWRAIREHDEAGRPVPVERRQQTDEWLQRNGQRFWTETARRLNANGSALPRDPYNWKWYTASEKDIFEAVGGELLYNDSYGSFSEWHHWRIGGFGALMRFDENTNTFTMSGNAPSVTVSALTSAFVCIWQTLKVLDEIASLGIETQLQRLYTEYTAGSLRAAQ